MGPGIYFFHSAAPPGVYLSSCLYLSPALIWINTIYLCLFYRPTDGNGHPITQLSESLHKLCSNQVIPPTILLAGDFNLPGIQWTEGCGQVSVNPAYGLEVNHSLVDTINDNSLEQLVGGPTRGANT